MRVYLIVLLLLLFEKSIGQIKILENTKEQFTIFWKIDSIDVRTILIDNAEYSELSFNGQNATSVDNKFLFPSYSFYVGVPPEGSINVQVLAEEINTIQLPNPLKRESTSKYQKFVYNQSPWISDPIYTCFDDYRTVHQFVKPVQYDSVTNQCRILMSGTISIRFPSTHNKSSLSNVNDETVLLREIVENYQIAKMWNKNLRLGKKKEEKYPITTSMKQWFFKIGDGNKDLNECTNNENGIIKITGAKLMQLLGPEPVTMQNLALYASGKKHLPETIPPIGQIPDGITEIPVLRFDKNGNNIVDNEDYILAYVTGTSDWEYKHGNFIYHINRYSDYRSYWLVKKNAPGLTMRKFEQAIGYSDTLDYFTNKAYYKKSIHPSPVSEGVLRYCWNVFLKTTQIFAVSIDNLPMHEVSLPGSISFDLSRFHHDFRAELNDEELCKGCYGAYPLSDWGNKKINLSFITNDTLPLAFYGLTATYQSKIQLDEQTTDFTMFSSTEPGIHTYRLTGVNLQQAYIIRIDTTNDISIVNITDNENSFAWTDSGNGGVKYFICRESDIVEVNNFESPSFSQAGNLTVSDIRTTLNKTDFLIITHPEFKQQAIELAAHKKKMGYANPVVADINDIYRYFSGGAKDPTAIRNFIAYVKRNWDKGGHLLYVVLFGVGHYDPKGYYTQHIDFIPVYQDSNADNTEDYFGIISATNEATEDPRPQCIIGRIPCRNKNDANSVVNKIKEMEDPSLADYGIWRNRMLFVTDDDVQGKKYDDLPHDTMSENVSELIEKYWPSMEISKVYLFDYKKDLDEEKKVAKRTIVDKINRGIAYVNFFGHGSHDLWTDEKVLTVKDISFLNNKKHYPLVSSFSCSVGKFDIPGEICLSGAFVTANSSGAIASISSTRTAYIYSNEKLANNFYAELFKSSTSRTIGSALYLARLKAAESNYAILGDPSIQILKPQRSIVFKVIDDSSGTIIDTLKAFQTVKITGTVNDNGYIDNAFGGTNNNANVFIGLYNPASIVSRSDNLLPNKKYVLPGRPVFTGTTKVRNGTFEQAIRIPRTLTFDKKGVKLTGYSWIEGTSVTAVGSNDSSLIFHGYSSILSNDSIGPEISIRPVYDDPVMNLTNVVMKDQISLSLPAKFEVVLYDDNGIDVSNNGPDEGFTVEIPGGLAKVNMNQKFVFKEGDFKQGKAVIELQENSIKEGMYELAVSACDLIGNLSKKIFRLEITTSKELEFGQVFNYPNPFRMNESTQFCFYHNQSSSQNVNATLKIYSLSGRLLRVFTNVKNGVTWDGRDQSGRLLSPNVYLYQITAKVSKNEKKIASKVKKVMIHPPR
jgi:hypothetical protein